MMSRSVISILCLQHNEIYIFMYMECEERKESEAPEIPRSVVGMGCGGGISLRADNEIIF